MLVGGYYFFFPFLHSDWYQYIDYWIWFGMMKSIGFSFLLKWYNLGKGEEKETEIFHYPKYTHTQKQSIEPLFFFLIKFSIEKKQVDNCIFFFIDYAQYDEANNITFIHTTRSMDLFFIVFIYLYFWSFDLVFCWFRWIIGQ